MYILLIKNDIAVSKAKRESIENMELGIYDSYAEITEEEFENMELPSKKENGIWVKTSEFPKIDYPAVAKIKSEPTYEEVIDALLGVKNDE